MIFKPLFLFIIIAFISCAPARVSQQYTSLTKHLTKGTYHLVKRGDSLWRISKKYSISVKELMQRNKISSPRNLKIGQKIFVPLRKTKSEGYFSWPTNGEVINVFNENVDNSINKGINIKTASGNKDVNACAYGKVVFSDNLKGWGKTVILKHDSSLYTIYANLADAPVKEGTYAQKGQRIGEIASGKNGNYLLHFEVRKQNIPQDPLKYLN